MSTTDFGKANWKDPGLKKLFIDLCIEETNTRGKKGSSLNVKSWDIIGSKIKEQKGVILSQRQLKNHWDYLKKKYTIWISLVGKYGDGYDPVTKTVNWTSQQWDDYLKVVPDAEQFRYMGLQHANELKSLFEGIIAIGRDSWGPSRGGLRTDDIFSSTSTQQLRSPIAIEVESESVAPSPKDEEKQKGKRRKKNPSIDEDGYIPTIIKTLTKANGPTIEECNRVLNKMVSITTDDPLYCMALIIFCESAAYRQQWLHVATMSEDVKTNWLKLVAKKLRLM